MNLRVSDTARWTAFYRALESKRPDALFRDPFADVLAGERGRVMAKRMRISPWAWTARTHAFDGIITRAVASGIDTVVNLAAGFDARPYRLDLPASLRWFEIDVRELLDEKERLLGHAKPRCVLERVPLDLGDEAARRALFARIGSSAQRALVVSEGLVLYLTTNEVRGLARDLAAIAPFESWATDLPSPGLLHMMRLRYSRLFGDRNVMHFGPPEGPAFFQPLGWTPVEVRSVLKTAADVGRLGFAMRLLAKVPEARGGQGLRPWVGVCLLTR